VGTLVLLALCHHDFHELPEKAYQAFGVVFASFPESFKPTALLLWTIVLVGFAAASLLIWVERDSKRTPFDPKPYLKILHALRDAWDGLLALGFFALVAGFSVGALAIWVGSKYHLSFLSNLSSQVRDGLLNAWWITAFVPLGAIFGIYFACDALLWAFGRAEPLTGASYTRGLEPFEHLFAQLKGEAGLSTDERFIAAVAILPLMVLAVPGAVMYLLIDHGTRPLVAASIAVPSGVALFLALGLLGDLLKGRRAALIPVLGVALGFVSCFFYFPALANQLSPKEVFESYERVHHGSEPLGLFGVGGRTAAYYAGGQPVQLHDTQGAYQWLTAGAENGRRYLAMKSEDLPKLNMLYRQHAEPLANLPVLDSRSSQILLVASKLEGGEVDENPLRALVLSSRPSPQRRLDVNMDDKLEVLGLDTVDEKGRLVDFISPGRTYYMKTYFHVLSETTEWPNFFVHIDGNRRRHNSDHKPLNDKYPMPLWQRGDFIVDEIELKLEPNFSAGAYTIYFGLSHGDGCNDRLPIKSGPNDGCNRVNGGVLRVQ
jgi:hypothetical protein